MAAGEGEKAEVAAEGAEPGEGAKKKKLILIGAGVALALLVGIGALAFLSGGKDGESEGKDGSEAAHEAAPVTLYEALGDKFVITLQHEGRQHYMQVALVAVIREAAVAEELKVHAPLIRSRLVSLFGAEDFAALRTDEGRLAMNEKALQTVREILKTETGSEGVERLLFTELVLQ